MYNLKILIREQTFTSDMILGESSVYDLVRDYLLAYGINVLLCEPMRDRNSFEAQLAKKGSFDGHALDAEIAVTRSP